MFKHDKESQVRSQIQCLTRKRPPQDDSGDEATTRCSTTSTRQAIVGQEPDSMFGAQGTTTGRFRGRRQQPDAQHHAHDKESQVRSQIQCSTRTRQPQDDSGTKATTRRSTTSTRQGIADQDPHSMFGTQEQRTKATTRCSTPCTRQASRS
jgi:hypothetical protein